MRLESFFFFLEMLWHFKSQIFSLASCPTSTSTIILTFCHFCLPFGPLVMYPHLTSLPSPTSSPGSDRTTEKTDSCTPVLPSSPGLPLTLSLSPALSPKEFEHMWLEQQPPQSEQGNLWVICTITGSYATAN